jgi:hypothetical protein
MQHINSNGYTPTFSTTTDLNVTTSMSADVVDYEFKMAATKSELKITTVGDCDRRDSKNAASKFSTMAHLT